MYIYMDVCIWGQPFIYVGFLIMPEFVIKTQGGEFAILAGTYDIYQKTMFFTWDVWHIKLIGDTSNEIIRFFKKRHVAPQARKTKPCMRVRFGRHFSDLGGVNWHSHPGGVAT